MGDEYKLDVVNNGKKNKKGGCCWNFIYLNFNKIYYIYAYQSNDIYYSVYFFVI